MTYEQLEQKYLKAKRIIEDSITRSKQIENERHDAKLMEIAVRRNKEMEKLETWHNITEPTK